MLLIVRWDRDTIFGTSAFNHQLCLVCVIIVRSLLSVSLNGICGKSWDRQNREHQSLDLTGTASTKNQIFYLTCFVGYGVDFYQEKDRTLYLIFFLLVLVGFLPFIIPVHDIESVASLSLKF